MFQIFVRYRDFLIYYKTDDFIQLVVLRTYIKKKKKLGEEYTLLTAQFFFLTTESIIRRAKKTNRLVLNEMCTI